MSAENHRLVILGSMDEFVNLVELAKKRGIYTIVCDGYEDGPAKAHADKTSVTPTPSLKSARRSRPTE